MSQIYVNDLTFGYTTSYDLIFEHVSFQLDTDWKLGFVGRNGRGKTTFLRLLMGAYDYQGTITSPVSFSYFPFEVEDEAKVTLSVIKDTIAPYTQWEQEMEQCLMQDHSEESLDRYGKLQELYLAHDGYVIEELIEKELGKLRVGTELLSRPYHTLSYGERTKLMLAALFLKKNNFLLIDEPTNHLDMEGRATLAEYLGGKGGFILVSHDRNFLDRCIDHVLSINRTDIEVQKGNYSTWWVNKERRDHYELNKNEQLKKEIIVLSDAAKRAKGWSDQVEAGKIGSHAFDRGAIGHKAAKMMKRAKAIESRKLDAIEEKKGLLKNIEEPEDLKINLLPFSGRRMMEAEDLSLYFDGRRVAAGY